LAGVERPVTVRTFRTCTDHFACVTVDEDGTVAHRPATRDAEQAIDSSRGTLAEASRIQKELTGQQAELADAQRALSEQARVALEQGREVKADLGRLAGDLRSELQSVAGAVKSFRDDTLKVCDLYMARAEDRFRFVAGANARLAEQEEWFERRADKHLKRAEATNAELDEHGDSLRRVEREMLDRVKQAMAELAEAIRR
jgi:phage-related tail protein